MKKKKGRLMVTIGEGDDKEDCVVLCHCPCQRNMLVLREHGAVRFIRFSKDNKIVDCDNVILTN